MKIGIITASDRGSRGEYDFLTGEEVEKILKEYIGTPLEIMSSVIPDEQDQLERQLKFYSDEANCAWIITAGGTGPAPRDVSPEATMAVCQKMLPGFGEQMRAHGQKFVRTAFLSRQTAGIRHNKTLILNMPGKPRAIRQCMDAIIHGIPHTLMLLGHEKLSLNINKATGEAESCS